MTRVRHLLQTDCEKAIGTLSSAFRDDPVTRWLLGVDEGFDGRLNEWMQFAVETGLAHGHIYSAEAAMGVAIWGSPHASLFDPPWGRRMGEMLIEMLGEVAAPRMQAMADATVGLHGDEPHFYLFMLGTHPDAQSRGIGSALLRRTLEVCDAEGLAAHLESSRARNVPFYERHGFEVISEVPLEPDGPVVRPMRRAPR